jgi:hypothetical protein
MQKYLCGAAVNRGAFALHDSCLLSNPNHMLFNFAVFAVDSFSIKDLCGLAKTQ